MRTSRARIAFIHRAWGQRACAASGAGTTIDIVIVIDTVIVIVYVIAIAIAVATAIVTAMATAIAIAFTWAAAAEVKRNEGNAGYLARWLVAGTPIYVQTRRTSSSIYT